MQKSITKDELLEKFGKEFSCDVLYKDKKETVKYESCKNVNWKNVHKITVWFNEPVLHRNDGETVSRKGYAYLLI